MDFRTKKNEMFEMYFHVFGVFGAIYYVFSVSLRFNVIFCIYEHFRKYIFRFVRNC